MKILLLAGGSGTRLWPLSRAKYPKQLFDLLGGKKTLLQATYSRLRKGFSARDIFISIGKAQRSLVTKQLPTVPAVQYLIEPEPKNTAAAIALAATHLAIKDKKTIFATANADHFVGSDEVYLKALKVAEKAIALYPDHIVLLGVRPLYPETGYGYIEQGAPLPLINGQVIYQAKRFVEKPDLKTATQYLKSGKYFWNPAWFVWRADTLLKLYEQHLPKMSVAFKQLAPTIGTPKYTPTLRQVFSAVESTSIDYGILEKTKKLLLVPVEISWVDIGHWRAVDQIMRGVLGVGDSHNLTHQGLAISLEGQGNFVSAPKGKLVAILGVSEMIVVDTGDVILVCPKNRAQEVKKIVGELKKNKLSRFL